MDCYLELLAKHSTVYRGSRTILQEQCLISASESYTTQAADLPTCYAGFTGFQFKPGSRIKVALLYFKCYKLGLLTYLSSLLEQYRPTQSLRSSSLDILSVPRSRIKTASRRFSIAVPSVWNSLPATIRAASSVGSFRSQLKTHLYHLSFDWP